MATWWSLHGLLALVPDGLPRVESVRIDATVVVFGVVVALVTSLLAGLVPALSLARARSRDSSSAAAAAARQARRSRHWRPGLVVAQVALAVTIVAAAGLLTRSVLRLQAVDIGLAADRLVFVQLSLPRAKYAERARHAQFLERPWLGSRRFRPSPRRRPSTRRRSPVRAAGMCRASRRRARAPSAPPRIRRSISNRCTPIISGRSRSRSVRGRAFTAADRAGAVEVAIVSEDVAARTWPGEAPIGKRLKMGGPDSRDAWRTVVGVAASTRYRELAKPRPTIYLPAAQFLETAQVLVLRTTAPLDQVAALARSQVSAVDPDVQVMGVAPFSQMLDGPLARPRFNAFLLSIFAVAALLLATIGLYAVLAAYRAPARSRAGDSRRAGSHADEGPTTRVGEALVARRRRRDDRPGRRRGGDPHRARHALRDSCARPADPGRRGAAAHSRVRRRFVPAGPPRHSCRRGPRPFAN